MNKYLFIERFMQLHCAQRMAEFDKFFNKAKTASFQPFSVYPQKNEDCIQSFPQGTVDKGIK